MDGRHRTGALGGRRWATLVIVFLLAIAGMESVAVASTGRSIRLRFFDRRGRELSALEARSRMTDGGAGWANDALVDPIHLFDLEAHPLYVDGTGHLAFDLPERPVALAVNWPTSRGYSMLILDDGGAGFTTGGVVDFTYRAALDAMRTLDEELAARPTYVRSAAFLDAYAASANDLDAANASADPSVRGRYGALALDELATANDLLLAGYGTQVAGGSPSIEPWLGVTIDTTAAYRSHLTLARDLTDPFGWVRIVMDPGTPFSDYEPVVRRAHVEGLKVMGQPIDSSYAAGFPGRSYLARIRRAVRALPAVDAWEIGNEVNGSWLGPNMADRLDLAATWLHVHHPAKTVVLTLYWQIGTDAPRWSTFNWIRDELKPSTISDTDVFLLSTWIEDAPMGLAFDRVLRALQDALPAHEVGIGELGYWGQGTSKAWWYGDRRDTTAARRSVLDQLYRASLGYRWSVGGVFWWYFGEEMPADAALAAELAAIRDDIVSGTAPRSIYPPNTAASAATTT